MTAVVTLTGALSHRLTVPGLQARMVKVGPQPGVRRGMTAFRKERSQGLSGMQGNLHVPFLGGWAGAIPPGYPAGESNLASLSRPICRRSKGGCMGTRRHRRNSRFCRRWTPQRRGETPCRR